MIIKNIDVSLRGIKLVDKYGQALTGDQAMSKIYVRVNNIFIDLQLLVLKIVGIIILSHTLRNWIYKIFGIKIDRGSTIHTGGMFFNPKGIEIGKDSIIGNGVFLDGRGKIRIGDHVDMASDVMVYNSQHDVNDPEFKATVEDVEIADYVFIGPRVIILPGVKIGRGAVLAAGCVVSKDVSDYAIVAGVPAEVIGERKNKKLNYILGRPRLFQ